MKTKIKQVQDYFKCKMLSQDFEIIKLSECTIRLVIDSEYEFIIWIGNMNIPHSTNIYKSSLSFMDVSLTNEECIKFNEVLLPVINKFKKETLLNKKKQELEQLQNELNGIS